MTVEAMAGAVLTGGRSRRMGGARKALLPLAGQPMIQYVIDRLAPQVARLMLSVDEPDPEFEPFGLRQVPDPLPGSRGPLGGLLATLRQAGPAWQWLLLAPCDAPFLPPDLGEKLLAHALASNRDAAVIEINGEVQPTFSIWHQRLLPPLEQGVLEEQLAGFKQFFDRFEPARLVWPATEPNPFFNINDPEALDQAAQMMGHITGNQ